MYPSVPPPEGGLAVNSMLFLCPALITRGVDEGGRPRVLWHFFLRYGLLGGVLVRVLKLFIVAVKSIVKLSISPMPCLFSLLFPASPPPPPAFDAKDFWRRNAGSPLCAPLVDGPRSLPPTLATPRLPDRDYTVRSGGWMMCKRLRSLAVSLPMTWRSFLCWDDAHEIARNFRRSPFCTAPPCFFFHNPEMRFRPPVRISGCMDRCYADCIVPHECPISAAPTDLGFLHATLMGNISFASSNARSL